MAGSGRSASETGLRRTFSVPNFLPDGVGCVSWALEPAGNGAWHFRNSWGYHQGTASGDLGDHRGLLVVRCKHAHHLRNPGPGPEHSLSLVEYECADRNSVGRPLLSR